MKTKADLIPKTCPQLFEEFFKRPKTYINYENALEAKEWKQMMIQL